MTAKIDSLPDLRPRIEKIARGLLGEPNLRLSTRTQLRFGTNGSVAVEIAGEKCGQWYDHEDAAGGGPWELLTVKGRMTSRDAIEWLRARGITLKLVSKASRQIVATYNYLDERGDLLFQVCRFAPKTFRQRRPDGNGDWIWNVMGTRQVPYRLPELIAAPADRVVFIVEGEKDADRLAGLGLIATCNAGGAAKPRANGKPGKSKWRPELNPCFAARDVVILPDNDDTGRNHARMVASYLAPVAARVRIPELPGLPAKGDISDWLDAGGTREMLEELAADAPTFSPGDDAQPAADQRDTPCNILGDEAEIDRLAKLSPIACDRELPATAERLGCRVPTLRAAVKAARGQGETAPGQGRPLDLPDPEPWPEPVDGAALLDALAGAIRRYVVLSPQEADAVALWVVGVHAFDAWAIFPRLFVTAPEKGCGKSTLLDVLSRLVPRPLGGSSITAAALFRTIEAARPTLLLDEADTYARENEDIRGVLDAGHRRDGAVIRTVGDNHEPRRFSAWAPVALAAIGHLPGTIEDRSVIIRLRRRRPDEPVLPLRGDRASELEDLARKTARWAKHQAEALGAADPEMPGPIYNRAADNWRPLLAVADLAGGGWDQRARKAAVELASRGEDTESPRVLLLGDLRELFAAERSGVLFTREIIAALVSRDDRQYLEWKAGKPITSRQIAALLKPLGIKTNQTVRRGISHDKGYRVEWFEDLFVRYLPPFSVGDTVTNEGFCGSRPDLSVTRSVTCHPNVTDTSHENPSVSAGCHRVTDPNPESMGEEGVWTV
jgi:putative DNA primase/helicase